MLSRAERVHRLDLCRPGAWREHFLASDYTSSRYPAREELTIDTGVIDLMGLCKLAMTGNLRLVE